MTKTASITSAISFGTYGTEAILITVQATITEGQPGIKCPQLEAVRVREMNARIGSAFAAAKEALPSCTVELLAGAARIRAMTGLDLPIALAVLAAKGRIPAAELEGLVVIGELGLDGSIRGVRGLVAVAEAAGKARGMLVAMSNSWEVALHELRPYPALDLAGVVSSLQGDGLWAPQTVTMPKLSPDLRASTRYDMSEVRGQDAAMTDICDAFATNADPRMLLVGPPGTGKTMIAKRIPTLLKELTPAEVLAVTKIYSTNGTAQAPITMRPFRAPHHTVSSALLAGDRRTQRPGEVHLARHGVLFLDELPEWPRSSIEALAGALGEMSDAEMPLIIAAANPCPCGYLGSGVRECSCGADAIARHQGRVEKVTELLNIGKTVRTVSVDLRTMRGPGESSAELRELIAAWTKIELELQGSTGEPSAPDLLVHAEHKPGGEWSMFTLGYSPERIQVLWYPEAKRAGVAWGANALWTACSSPRDAARRYLRGTIAP